MPNNRLRITNLVNIAYFSKYFDFFVKMLTLVKSKFKIITLYNSK